MPLSPHVVVKSVELAKNAAAGLRAGRLLCPPSPGVGEVGLAQDRAWERPQHPEAVCGWTPALVPRIGPGEGMVQPPGAEAALCPWRRQSPELLKPRQTRLHASNMATASEVPWGASGPPVWLQRRRRDWPQMGGCTSEAGSRLWRVPSTGRGPGSHIHLCGQRQCWTVSRTVVCVR